MVVTKATKAPAKKKPAKAKKNKGRIIFIVLLITTMDKLIRKLDISFLSSEFFLIQNCKPCLFEIRTKAIYALFIYLMIVSEGHLFWVMPNINYRNFACIRRTHI